MAISGEDVFLGKVNQFASQASHSLFTQDYITAANAVLVDIAADMDEDTVTLTDKEDDFALEQYCLPALLCGLDYWLIRYGHKSGDLDIATALLTYREARTQLRQSRQMAESRDADDGVVIGLTE